MFFPFVISTLLWLNNSSRTIRQARNGPLVNGVLGAALLLYVVSGSRSHRPESMSRSRFSTSFPFASGFTSADALREAVDLARFTERLGFTRYWFAEHHGMASVASSAPEILIAHVAAATTSLRVGSGGIMLPNHAPLHVAEVFHTLEALHPGPHRPGHRPRAGHRPRHLACAASLRRRPSSPTRCASCARCPSAPSRRTIPFASVRVVPPDVTLPPIWVLASSGETAAFAGSQGLGYAFAQALQPDAARSRRSARIARRSGRRRSFPRRT